MPEVDLVADAALASPEPSLEQPAGGQRWKVIAYVLVTLAIMGVALFLVLGFASGAGAAGDCGGI